MTEPVPQSSPRRAGLAYLGRRLAHTACLLFGVSLLSFLLIEMAPGEVFDEMRLNPRVSPESVAALRAQYGLDQPFAVRYVRWLGSALRGELGVSLAYNSPVGPLLWVRAGNTLLLTGTALALAWLIALPLGVWSAAGRGRWLDRCLGRAMTGLLALPDLLLALALLWLAVRTGWFPAGGMRSLASDSAGWADLALHLLLPVVVLVLVSLPTLVRHVRAAMLEVLDSPFIRAARGYGIPQGRLLFRHALPAAANPLVSLFGLSLGTLLSASLLIEVVMSWPGMGPLLLEAILARDLYVVVAAVVFSAGFLIAGSLVADLLLYVADPRIRTEAGS